MGTNFIWQPAAATSASQGLQRKSRRVLQTFHCQAVWPETCRLTVAEQRKTHTTEDLPSCPATEDSSGLSLVEVSPTRQGRFVLCLRDLLLG